MELKGKQIGVAITGSFCTYKKLFTELENLVLEGAEVQTIFQILHRKQTAVLEMQRIS